MCYIAGHAKEPGIYSGSNGNLLEGFKQETEMILTFAFKRALWLLCGEWRREGIMEAGRDSWGAIGRVLGRDDGRLDESLKSTAGKK